MANWAICSGEREAVALEAYVRACDAGATISCVGDAAGFRERLRGDLRGATALVAEGARGPAAVNVAAAVAADGGASQVVLAVPHASGSLRSRAKSAGIDRVITEEELAAARSREAVERKTMGIAGAMAAGRATASERRQGVPVVTFVSGRGGVGKSTIVATCAHVAASWGLDVACLDLDLAFGNLSALAGAERPADLAQVTAGALDDEAFESLGAVAGDRVRVWGPCREPEYAECVQPLAADIIARLTQSHDLVLIDTSASWGDATASAAQAADRLVIVSDDRPGAIAALARCGGLAVRLGIARTRIVRLMNGCDPKMRDESFVARAAVGLECAREVRVPDGGLEVVELLATGGSSELATLDGAMPRAVAHGLAAVLKELGRLPEGDAPARALAGGKRQRRLFGRVREAS